MKTEDNKRKHKTRSLIAELGAPTGGLWHYFGLKERISRQYYKLLSTSFILMSLFVGALSGSIKDQTTHNTISNENFHYEEVHEKRRFFPYPVSYITSKVAETISPSKEWQRFFVSNENSTGCEYRLEDRLVDPVLSQDFLDSFPIVPTRVTNQYGKIINSNNNEFRKIANKCHDTLKEKLRENNELYEGSNKNPFYKNRRLAIR